MDKYGITDKGFVRKRYDVITEELQEDIKTQSGIDISTNPQSFLNVLVSLFADKISELWEELENVYFSHYPSTAEGINLDYACQFGGLFREEDERTQYNILCTGTDGIAIVAGTRIATNTSPQLFFQTYADYEISRQNFSKAKVNIVSIDTSESYTVYLDDTAYTYLSDASGVTRSTILKGLKDAINDNAFTVSIDGDYLVIESINQFLNHKLELSENLSTKSVSSIIVFQSEDYGKIVASDGSINTIITNIVGFDSCYNLPSPIYGRLRETDIEYRQSYINKRAIRSSTMLDSIASAILKNVDGVTSCVAYENTTDSKDNLGRPPHSIEIIVDGGSEQDIGQQILLYKAAGIQTYGSVSVNVPTKYGDSINIKFNRPTQIYVWLKVVISKNPNTVIMAGYEDIIKDTVMDNAEDITTDQTAVIQKLVPFIDSAVSGIAYMTITGYTSTNLDSTPSSSDYTLRYITFQPREKVYFDRDRILVEVGN